jgi:hypothetical protein
MQLEAVRALNNIHFDALLGRAWVAHVSSSASIINWVSGTVAKWWLDA